MKPVPDLSERLRAHAEWVVSNGERGRRLMLVEADLSGLDNKTFYGADLTRALFLRCNFSRSRLIEVTLKGANLKGSCFDRALVRTTYESASGALFAGTSMVGADLSCIHMAHADFSGVDFSGAALGQCTFYGCNFSGANLSETNLVGSEASFEHTDLSNTRMPNPTLEVGKVYVLSRRYTVTSEAMPHLLVEDDGKNLRFLGPDAATRTFPSWFKWTKAVRKGARGATVVL